MGVAALIPAKMTSIRFPKKNVTRLCGHPLIYFSVRIAQLVPDIDDVWVSSESAELLALARDLGAQVVPRPAELSLPHVRNTEVMNHFYDSLEEKPEIVVLLQPTHPLRHPDEIASAVRTFRNSEADVMFSLVKTNELRGTIVDGRFIPEVALPRTAPGPETYRNCGSFYLLRPETSFLTERPFGRTIAPYVMKYPEFEVDIDYEGDMQLAECLLKNNRKRFGHFEI